VEVLASALVVLLAAGVVTTAVVVSVTDEETGATGALDVLGAAAEVAADELCADVDADVDAALFVWTLVTPVVVSLPATGVGSIWLSPQAVKRASAPSIRP
jgi:hypothetical protein